MPKQTAPTSEELATLTIYELELRYRGKRQSFIRLVKHQLHGRRGVVLTASAFFVALLLFFVWVGEQPIRATYAGERLTPSVWSQLEASSTDRLSAMQVTLKNGETEQVFRAADLGVRFDEATTRELIEASELKRKLLPWQLLDERAYTPTLEIDKTILLSTLGEAGLLNNPPTDAELRFEAGALRVIPGSVGQTVDLEVFAEQLLKSAITLDAVTIELPLMISEPGITTAIAEQSALTVQAFLDKPLMARYNGGEYQVSQTVVGGWMVFESKPFEQRIDFRLDETRVRQHAEQFAGSLSRVKRDSVVYRTPSGEQIVSVSGVTGRSVTNTDAIAAAWMKQADADVLLSEEPFAVRDGGLLNRYVVVDLNTYTVSAHDSDTVVATFPISGGKPSTPTPLGTFRIFAKTRVQTMSGPGYSTPNVEWISWFYPDYALHGAYWHNSFGQANVSHGCVNMRNADAEWIYNWAPIGTTVIVRQG